MLRSVLNGAIKRFPIWIFYVLYLLFRFARFLLEVPTVRMIEYAACHQQLDRGAPNALLAITRLEEEACKIASIQELLARIVGWKMSLDAFPGLVSAIYFAGIADKRGPRFVLTLCCVGYLLALLWMLMTCYFHNIFPVSVTLLSSLFLFAGGGPLVFAADTVSLVANQVDFSSRTRYLFILAAMPPLAIHLDALSEFLPTDINEDIMGPPVISPSKLHIYTDTNRRPISSMRATVDNRICKAGSRPSQKPAPSNASIG